MGRIAENGHAIDFFRSDKEYDVRKVLYEQPSFQKDKTAMLDILLHDYDDEALRNELIDSLPDIEDTVLADIVIKENSERIKLKVFNRIRSFDDLENDKLKNLILKTQEKEIHEKIFDKVTIMDDQIYVKIILNHSSQLPRRRAIHKIRQHSVLQELDSQFMRKMAETLDDKKKVHSRILCEEIAKRKKKLLEIEP